MNLKAYKEWKDLFNENISNVWQEEPIPVLKNLSMLLVSIKHEIKNIEVKVDNDVSNLRKNVTKTSENQNILLEIQSKEIDNSKENIQLKKTKLSFSPSKNVPDNVKVDSPDMFQNVEAPLSGANDSSSIIISDEDTGSTLTKESPEIKKKKRNHASQKRSQRWQKLQDSNTSTMSLLRGLQCYQGISQGSEGTNEKQEQSTVDDKSSVDFLKGLVSHTQISSEPFNKNGNGALKTKEQEIVLTPVKDDREVDLSLVQGTPIQVVLPKRKDKASSYLSKRKYKRVKSTTLTQMLSRKDSEKCEEKIVRTHASNYDSDETYFDPTQGGDRKISKLGTVMGITQMVSFLNTHSPSKEKNSTETNKAQGVINLDPNTQQIADLVDDIRYEDFEDESSLNSAIIVDDEKEEVDVTQGLNDFLAKAQNVPQHHLEPEPVVRGKARQKLPGWSCKDCEKFYLKQGLNPEEILALNKCSKHRGYFRPREDTVPGFWDMAMVTQESKNT